MNEPTVTIDIQTYNDLILAHEKYEMLLDAIYNDAELSWDKKFLAPQAQKFNAILSIIDPVSYDSAIEELKKGEKTDE